MTDRPGLDKPLDVGNGLIAGSVDGWGRLLAVGTHHERLGYAVLEAGPPFPDESRRSPEAVRAYRAGLADPQARGLGFAFDEAWTVVSRDLVGAVVPRVELVKGSLSVTVTTWAVRVDGRPLPVVAQLHELRNTGDEPARWETCWGGPLRLGRAALSQLTEGGILTEPSESVVVDHDGDVLTAVKRDVGLAAVIEGFPGGPPRHVAGHDPLETWLPMVTTLPAGGRRGIELAVGLASSVDEARATTRELDGRDLQALLDDDLARWRTTVDPLDERLPRAGRRLVRRAVAYTLACCALPVDGGLCLLTDHRILPLGWTRDAYYTVRMLQAAGVANADDLRRRHLLWLFETCERPEGAFARSYLPNGRAKDRAFQLDQQCYPLLELTDHLEATQDASLARRLAPKVRKVLAALVARRAPDAALFATDETPGDDPLDMPYHFSSHVLLWHTLRRLGDLDLDVGDVLPRRPADVAEEVRNDTRQWFAVATAEGPCLAYAVDAEGGHVLYHDANDLPTVLAPLWGFCDVADPAWRATMTRAFSPANVGGWYPGPHGGLGSVHTPGAWPLGDVQELIYARLTGDEVRASRVLARLERTACTDGSLPEARDPDTGAVRSRHWFAWPGAMLAAALLDPTTWQPRDRTT